MGRRCDLVLGGGGVRGLAHVGALAALEDAGLTAERVAGASAGAIAGALVVAGVAPTRMRQLAHDLDYRGFALADLIDRATSTRGLARLLERRAPEPVDPRAWLAELLAEHGVETFGDLRVDDPDADLPPGRRYRLVVRCLDVVHRRAVRLPWDYPRYGLDPDRQSVADAVRASMSVPFVFAPVPIGAEGDERAGLLVDGGLTSGFPVTLWDRRDGRDPRWPTFGVRLLPRDRTPARPEGNLGFLRALLDTMLESGDATEPTDVRDEERTVRIDTAHLRPLDLGTDQAATDALFEAGREAMEAFLDGLEAAGGDEAADGGRRRAGAAPGGEAQPG
ncbi:MAG: patatin-like phospholipase family protein [Actinomycetes bacterium]